VTPPVYEVREALIYTAQELADKLEAEEGLVVKAPTLRKWAKDEEMPIAKKVKGYSYNNASYRWVLKNKRESLENHKGRGRPGSSADS
jgi:hypothetical protein